MAIEELLSITEQLYQYLEGNGKTADAIRIKEIKNALLDEKNDNKNVQLKRLGAMCSVKYLGDVNIKEFNNSNDWWNFLGRISVLVNKELCES